MFINDVTLSCAHAPQTQDQSLSWQRKLMISFMLPTKPDWTGNSKRIMKLWVCSATIMVQAPGQSNTWDEIKQTQSPWKLRWTELSVTIAANIKMCLYLQNTFKLVSENFGNIFFVLFSIKWNRDLINHRFLILLHFTKCPKCSGIEVAVAYWIIPTIKHGILKAKVHMV